MSDAVKIVPITAAPNPAGYVATDVILPTCTVDRIILQFPPGCCGLVGVVIASGGSNVYPPDTSTGFFMDDYKLEIPVTNQTNSGQWAVAVLNTDVLPHTITAYFFYTYYQGSPDVLPSMGLSL
jgi:hypothetical protein